MRNFKKVMALAVSVAAICSSVSAFAELEYNFDGALDGIATYTAGTHSLTLDVDDAAGDKTVLVLDKDVEDTAATGDDILYINQYTASETAYAAMGLKGSALEAGEYLVKFGYEDENGDFGIKEGKIIVTEKKPDEPQFVEVLWGDIDSDGKVAIQDAGAIVTVVLGGTEQTKYTIDELLPGTEVLWGDIDTDGKVAIQDAGAIVTVVLGGTEATKYTIDTNVQIPKVND